MAEVGLMDCILGGEGVMIAGKCGVERGAMGLGTKGVWPESESFNDEGFGPIPSRWKGICQNDNTNDRFSCNKLKNVGAPGRYTGRVRLPQRIFSASVNPRVLELDHIGQEKSFNVTIKVLDADAVNDTYVFGELRWTDHVHYVRSPITIASMSDISYMN
ncbi:hypothetical protein H5410_020551 [Solanum commersonii]|uniref:Subtilisin-like protease fibronectin type-III domain-containing protein n=1 Tax=Solanum commersonii TaxID=4109 RepID=A0A9J5ZEJ0_SOLCO|nr:hypothetical protein H5410_020551 [Solanum commersonii]